jgi:hypothetical protein
MVEFKKKNRSNRGESMTECSAVDPGLFTPDLVPFQHVPDLFLCVEIFFELKEKFEPALCH